MKRTLSIGSVLILSFTLLACEKPSVVTDESSKKVVVEVNTEKKTKKVPQDKKEEKIIEDKEVETGKTQESEDAAEVLEKENKVKTADDLIVEETKSENIEDKEKKDERDSEREEESAMPNEFLTEKSPVVLTQQTLLILDASGSMWGQIEGQAKIEIAKEVVKTTVKNFENTELGLMAYGHRRKGDCSDIEILTSPKKDNAKNISDMVDKISPKGMTPMGNSVLMAAESLKYTEQKATVILVSDGIETCDIDLCVLGKKLEETGVDFTAHVIGFDMTEEQTVGLKCLANETGGTFTSAKNADDLGKALEETVEASSCSKEKLGEAVITAPSEIDANKEFEITWTGLNNEKDYIGIFPKDSSEWNDHLDIFGGLDNKNNKGTLRAPMEVGEYDIVYFAYCGETLGRTSLTVKKVFASLTIPETASAGSEIDISWEGPNSHNDYISISPKDSSKWNEHLDTLSSLVTKDGQGKLTVPLEVGEYDVLYWLGQKEILARSNFVVKEVSASLTIPEAADSGSKIDISWIGPNNSGDYIGIFPKGSTEWREHFDTISSLDSQKGQGSLTSPLAAGEYDVVYWQHQKEILTRQTFVVNEVSASLTIPATVDAGSKIEVSWAGPNNSGDYIGIFPKGSTSWKEHFDTISSLYSKEGQGKLTSPLEVGEYDVVYWQKQKEILARKTFTVMEVSAFFDIPASVTKDTEFDITWDGPNNSGDYIGIFPKGSTSWNEHFDTIGSLYSKKGQGKIDSPEEIGEYDIIYWQKQKKIITRETFTVSN